MIASSRTAVQIMFAGAVGVPTGRVSLQENYCGTATLLVMIALGRELTPEAGAALVAELEAVRELLPSTVLVRVQVFTGEDWGEVVALSEVDRRPALILAGPEGGMATVLLLGTDLRAEDVQLEQALLTLRRYAAAA